MEEKKCETCNGELWLPILDDQDQTDHSINCPRCNVEVIDGD